MTIKDKKYLVKMLSEANSELRASLEGIDLELRVYSDAGWRVRDIIGHIAFWDRQVTKSISALLAGTEYYIPNFDEDTLNQQAVSEQREMTAQQVFVDWVKAREEFINAIEDMSADQFSNDLLYPWGDERGNIVQLVEYMIEHDAEHREEIKGK